MALDAAATETIELLVPGLHCAGCMRRVEEALAAVPGVVAAHANLTERRARIIQTAGIGADPLIEALLAEGFEARRPDTVGREAEAARAEARDLLLRIGVAGFATMNVMLLSVSVWSGADGTTRDLLHWISALIALPAIGYAGRPFYQSAAAALAGGRLNMDVPISLAILLSAVGSVIETARSGEHAYFDAGIMLLFFLLIGRWLEQRSRSGARSAAAELATLLPRETTVIEAGDRHRRPVEVLQSGMEIELAPGERIPADGSVLVGESTIDRALLTGESRPEPVSPGAALHAGMLNLTGVLRMRVCGTGEATVLADIARMVDAAQTGRGRWDGWADRAARVYAPGVHLAALAAFVGWSMVGEAWAVSLQIACAVLIITCPCALALAVPTVHTVATGRLLRSGIFLKDGSELERMAEVDLIAFDKTGTLTHGTPRLASDLPASDPAWGVARALAEASRHPAAMAVAEAARHAEPAPVEAISEVPGCGVEGSMDGARVRLGRSGWAGQGEGTMLSLPGGRPLSFHMEEQLRPDAVETCAALRAKGYRLALLSGDRAEAVTEIARRCGIEETHAALLPGDKRDLLEKWCSEGLRVLMVGDGLNDGPALAAAHASMSPAEAADVSRVAAGLVWSGPGLRAVPLALGAALEARRRAIESFAMAAVYNLVAIPMAVMGFVTPLVAALAMSGSSIVVVLNALRLRVDR
ncbi:MAG: heavy metal translocating P-type ATPase [Pseudomonadota bacterium]